MGTNHSIPVDIARSVRRKIDVHIEQGVTGLQYEFTQLKKIHGHPYRGTTVPKAVVTGAITLALLLIIVTAVMLLLNG